MAVQCAVGAKGSHHEKPPPGHCSRRPFAWHGAASRGYGAARAGVRAPSASATRPLGFSRITRHETRNTAFMLFTRHETRKHGLFLAFFGRRMVRNAGQGRIAKNRRPVTVSRSPFAWHGAASRGNGAARAGVRAPSASATRPLGFSRNTRHETRNTAFFSRASAVGW